VTTTYIISLAIQLAVVIAVVVIVLLLARPGRSGDRSELEIEMNRLHDDIASVRETLSSSLASQAGVFRAELKNTMEQFKQEQPDEIPTRLAQLEQVLGGLGKRLQELQQDMAGLTRRGADSAQEMKHIIREETQPLRNQLLDLANDLPTQVRQIAGALEPAVSALEGKLGDKHQAAIDLTLLQLTAALNQTETRLADTVRRQEVLVTEVKSDLSDIQRRLAELEPLLRSLTRPARAPDATVSHAGASRDSAIPLPSRVPPGGTVPSSASESRGRPGDASETQT
jgi:DNA repair exonuclease SbcCD ATPase subunit